MPTYSYACTQCDNRFDIVQSFSDDTLTECPECTGKLRKLFNSVGIVFKGSGFYRTDSRSGAGTVNAQSSESKSDASQSKSDSKSSDSKPSTSEKSKSESSSKSTPAAIAS
ncbi:MAG TPA: FmdB family zinc ribbon protein [Aldersonia sp.]